MPARLPHLLQTFVILCCVAAAQPTLTVDQPCGAGSWRLQVSGAGPGAALYNLIQLTPHTPTGAGPLFGLGTAGSAALITQLLSPLGSHPFHVLADGSGEYTFDVGCPTPLGTSIEADVVTIEWGPSGYVAHSSVVYGCYAL